jgi:class 3 adenylate cyclase
MTIAAAAHRPYDRDRDLDRLRETGLKTLYTADPEGFRRPRLAFLADCCLSSTEADDDKLACVAFILSIDLRHSTRVLEEVKGAKFAEFMERLCDGWRGAIVANYGICYQYTGDGLLSIFPRFYTGEHVAYWVAKAADACHKVFAEVFEHLRPHLEFVPSGMGLGIGIDWGRVWIVKIVDEYVCVGSPVVSACRMCGGEPFMTLANQQGHNELLRFLTAHPGIYTLATHSVYVKHKGDVESYSINEFCALSIGEEASFKPSWDQAREYAN